MDGDVDHSRSQFILGVRRLEALDDGADFVLDEATTPLSTFSMSSSMGSQLAFLPRQSLEDGQKG